MDEYAKIVERLKDLKQQAILIEIEQSTLRRRLRIDFKTVTGL